MLEFLHWFQGLCEGLCITISNMHKPDPEFLSFLFCHSDLMHYSMKSTVTKNVRTPLPQNFHCVCVPVTSPTPTLCLCKYCVCIVSVCVHVCIHFVCVCVCACMCVCVYVWYGMCFPELYVVEECIPVHTPHQHFQVRVIVLQCRYFSSTKVSFSTKIIRLGQCTTCSYHDGVVRIFIGHC